MEYCDNDLMSTSVYYQQTVNLNHDSKLGNDTILTDD